MFNKHEMHSHQTVSGTGSLPSSRLDSSHQCCLTASIVMTVFLLQRGDAPISPEHIETASAISRRNPAADPAALLEGRVLGPAKLLPVDVVAQTQAVRLQHVSVAAGAVWVTVGGDQGLPHWRRVVPVTAGGVGGVQGRGSSVGCAAVGAAEDLPERPLSGRAAAVIGGGLLLVVEPGVVLHGFAAGAAGGAVSEGADLGGFVGRVA
mmetsp:Transcript_19230/g.27528  ORF Transcript_19230/g.27528 Transcript_19230/m.27528 type:complete len:207 (-) Transcript_19230:241-861(-)